MNNHYTFKEIIQSLPQKKNSKSSLWVKFFIRKISFIFTYVFVNLKITPWMASVLSAIIAFAGSILMFVDNNICRIIGVVFIELWLVFDCVDGNIARVTKTCSYMGDFIDTLSGYVISACSLLSIGFAATYTTTINCFQNSYILIIMGAIGSIGNVFSRLLHQNYMVTLYRLEKQGISLTSPDDGIDVKKGIGYIRSRVDKEIGISGLFMPMLIICAALNYLDIFVIVYGSFFGLSALVICFYYILKSRK